MTCRDWECEESEENTVKARGSNVENQLELVLCSTVLDQMH